MQISRRIALLAPGMARAKGVAQKCGLVCASMDDALGESPRRNARIE
jgi:hypothetical protein